MAPGEGPTQSWGQNRSQPKGCLPGVNTGGGTEPTHPLAAPLLRALHACCPTTDPLGQATRLKPLPSLPRVTPTVDTGVTRWHCRENSPEGWRLKGLPSPSIFKPERRAMASLGQAVIMMKRRHLNKGNHVLDGREARVRGVCQDAPYRL